MARRAKVMGEAGEEEGVGTVLFTLCYVFFIHRFMLIKCISAHHTQCLLAHRRGCVHSLSVSTDSEDSFKCSCHFAYEHEGNGTCRGEEMESKCLDDLQEYTFLNQ